jgi:large subunit ribosomal protein L10
MQDKTNIKFNPRKTSALSELADLVKNAKSVAVLDYKGMSVAQATEIRKAVKKVGGDVKVTKNTLFKIALGKKDLDLSGLSAFVFSNADEISALKIVADYAKKNNILAFKMGLIGDRVLSDKETLSLANTPSKETSIGKLMYLLNFTTSQFVRTLDAISKKEVTNS